MPKPTRERMYPDYQISKRREHFQQPPCQPPKGKDILERYFDVLYVQPVNKRCANDAAYAVAVEVRELWQRGDARIPLQTAQTIKKRILHFRDDLLFIQKQSKKGQPSFQEAVSIGREREKGGGGEQEKVYRPNFSLNSD